MFRVEKKEKKYLVLTVIEPGTTNAEDLSWAVGGTRRQDQENNF